MLLFRKLYRPFACFDAPNDGGGGGNTPNDPTPPADPPTPPADKTFTQAEVDKIVGDRLKRESGKLLKEAQDAAKAEADKANLSEVDRLKNELQDKDKTISDVTAKANAKAITAEAKTQAVALGIKPERVNAALKLADLSGVEIGEDGEPNAEQVKTAVNAVLAEYPEFKASAGGGKGGSEFGSGGGGGTLTDEIIANMTPEELSKRMPEIEAYYKTRK